MAIVGFHQFQYKNQSIRFLSSHLEHKSVIECMHSIEALGSKVCFIKPNEHGRIDIETFVNQMEKMPYL